MHEDRELVDLIWFPTGGGKTEAYLGLAAIEIFRRRLAHGDRRRWHSRHDALHPSAPHCAAVPASRLARVCDGADATARSLGDDRAKGMAPFSIGLWVGNEVTPGTRSEAKAALERLRKAARPEEANQFQVESCPWCGTPLVPQSEVRRPAGSTASGSIGNDIVIHCTNVHCEFYDELPVAVVDDVLYDAAADDPPRDR